MFSPFSVLVPSSFFPLRSRLTEHIIVDPRSGCISPPINLEMLYLLSSLTLYSLIPHPLCARLTALVDQASQLFYLSVDSLLQVIATPSYAFWQWSIRLSSFICLQSNKLLAAWNHV